MVTPVDFQTEGNLLSKWAQHLDMDLMQRLGNISGTQLTALFLSLRPFRLGQQKYVKLLDQLNDPAALEMFLRVENWVFDSPDQPAQATAEFVKWFYQENRLVRATLSIAGRRVDLKAVRMPVLNVFATGDHIVPPASSMALRGRIGSVDYSELAVDTGHIGMYVSLRAQAIVPAKISRWLAERA
jgi:polyhydroxyalkanoate synthase